MLAVIMIVWAGLNVAKFLIYSDYHSSKADVTAISGLNDDFVCQGICVDEESGKILVCG